MKYLILILSCISLNAQAKDAWQSSLDACKESKDLYFCQQIEDAQKKIEKTANEVVKQLNPQAAAATGVLLKIAVEQRIEYKLANDDFWSPKVKLTPQNLMFSFGTEF